MINNHLNNFDLPSNLVFKEKNKESKVLQVYQSFNKSLFKIGEIQGHTTLFHLSKLIEVKTLNKNNFLLKEHELIKLYNEYLKKNLPAFVFENQEKKEGLESDSSNNLSSSKETDLDRNLLEFDFDTNKYLNLSEDEFFKIKNNVLTSLNKKIEILNLELKSNLQQLDKSFNSNTAEDKEKNSAYNLNQFYGDLILNYKNQLDKTIEFFNSIEKTKNGEDNQSKIIIIETKK
ncbi:MAG: hypothetical protein Q8K60_07075 [Parachlamydiaceae bacterium]|nr:hypothetical protein [Parachlamydiaceae bacterium]